MANRKISDLTALTAPAAGDLLPIVDISEALAADKNKRITLGTLLSGAPLGSAAAPSFAFLGDPNTGIYSPGADQWAISTNGTGRIIVDASGNVNIDSNTLYVDAANNRVGIGTPGPSETLHVVGSIRAGAVGDFVYANNLGQISSAQPLALVSNSETVFKKTSGTELARIDSSGRLLVGTSSAFDATADAVIQAAATNGAFACLGNSDTSVIANENLGLLRFFSRGGSVWEEGARIEAEADLDHASGDKPTRLVFSVTPDGGSSPTTSPSAMTINSGQEVLIGYSTDNGAYKLQVNSQIFATSATVATSDGRYKENVATLDDCVDLIKALRPVSFDWKHQEPITRINEKGETVVVREAHNFPGGTQVGFIAQEVQEVLTGKPWLTSVIRQNMRPVINDSDGNELAPEEEFFGIAEGNLVAVLTSALKDTIGRIETLEARLSALEDA